ncbi:MAG: DegT/DnrJ/EryC1/StrS family aminotransferase [Chloroflexi bacterium]|nr:DegT/DnrJ/EryC1/StrS family aminotransferase [Chloroflexota bacterium]
MTKHISPVVPMSSPDISEEDREAVNSVIHTTYLSMGPWIDRFENAIRAVTMRKHAIAVNSGTAGLHLAIRAVGIQRGDIVITTPFSFVASTNAILFENALPVFVDVDPVTGNLDVEQLKMAVNDLSAGGERARKWLPRKLPRYFNDAGSEIYPRLKALLPVDVFGQPADMDTVMSVAREYNLPVIEDSCEALGAMYKNIPAGKQGDIGIFAFYPNKQITTGEGGMIVTDNDDYAACMQALRNQGRAPGDNWLQHTLLGYNYRLDEMSAALGASQVKRLESLLAARQNVADLYTRHLANIQGIEPLTVVPSTTRMSWFVYVVRVSQGVDRMKVADRLAAKGVPVRPYFLPIHLQPYMVERFGYRPGDYPITEDLGDRGLALPFSGVMRADQVEMVCEALRESL